MRAAFYESVSTYIRGGSVPLEVGLDGLVLLVEEGKIGDEILDDVGVRKGVDLHLSAVVGGNAACGLEK